MANINGPILPLQLDPRNTAALVKDTQTKIFLESNGQLNDFSAASPLTALVEGQAYAQSELLYYLNSLPEAYTLQWLRTLGIQRSIGSKAVVDVTFSKVSGFGKIIIIPKGTILSTISQLNFILEEDVLITDENIQGKGRATAEKWGTAYNVGVGEIQKINTNILGLSSATNENSAQGGKDLESIEELKNRTFSLLRRRGLVSPEDYENEVFSLAPEASVVKVLSYEEKQLLNEDVPTGLVAICIGGENGVELEENLRESISKSLRKRSVIGTAFYLTSPVITPIETVVSIEYDDSLFSGELDNKASQINSIISEFFSITNINLGESFNYQDLKNQIFTLDFVNKVNSLSIKLLKTENSATDSVNFCNPPFVSSLVDGVCITDYESVIDSDQVLFTNTDPVRGFRYYKNSITLVAKSSQSPLTYSYLDSEYRSLLGG
jgi:hypothetical protein